MLQFGLCKEKNSPLAECCSAGGDVFENVESREITDEEIKLMEYRYDGIDFGFAVDPFVWLSVAYDKRSKTLYFVNEIYEIKLGNSSAVEKIKAKGRGDKVITADSAEHGISWLQGLAKIVIDKNRTPNAHRKFTHYENERDKNGNYISRFPIKTITLLTLQGTRLNQFFHSVMSR